LVKFFFFPQKSETQKKMLEDVQNLTAERAKAEQELIDFTKRIDAERNLVEAQQEADLAAVDNPAQCAECN
jgi:hypothetical protein